MIKQNMYICMQKTHKIIRIMNNIVSNIKRIREQKGYSQEYMANSVGYGTANIFENGK